MYYLDMPQVDNETSSNQSSTPNLRKQLITVKINCANDWTFNSFSGCDPGGLTFWFTKFFGFSHADSLVLAL